MKVTARQRAREVTLDECRRALVVTAQLVEVYGDKYLPLFEQMEADFLELQRRGSAVERARSIARLADPKPAGRLVGDLLQPAALLR